MSAQCFLNAVNQSDVVWWFVNQDSKTEFDHDYHDWASYIFIQVINQYIK